MFRSKSPFVAQVNAILQTDETLTDQLATITAPTLVIVGTRTCSPPRRLGRIGGHHPEHGTHRDLRRRTWAHDRTRLHVQPRGVRLHRPRRITTVARSQPVTARVVVIGAGLSGLTAARTLTEHGIDVVVIDKGKSPGGESPHVGSVRPLSITAHSSSPFASRGSKRSSKSGYDMMSCASGARASTTATAIPDTAAYTA